MLWFMHLGLLSWLCGVTIPKPSLLRIDISGHFKNVLVQIEYFNVVCLELIQRSYNKRKLL